MSSRCPGSRVAAGLKVRPFLVLVKEGEDPFDAL